jgi:hypothetical protein
MRFPADSGRASLEFLVGAVILFVPLIAFHNTLASLSQSQLAAEAAARHGARVFTQHTNFDEAVTATESAIADAARQYFSEPTVHADLGCRPRGECLSPGSFIDLEVTLWVPLGSIPLISADLPLTLPISAQASAQVSPYRGQP